jgi:hypothetical protein
MSGVCGWIVGRVRPSDSAASDRARYWASIYVHSTAWQIRSRSSWPFGAGIGCLAGPGERTTAGRNIFNRGVRQEES